MAELARLLRANPARLMYSIPCAHNPSGGTLDGNQRSELLSLTRQSNLMLIEDAAYADIRYGAYQPPLATLDPELKNVVLVAAFRRCFRPACESAGSSAMRKSSGNLRSSSRPATCRPAR